MLKYQSVRVIKILLLAVIIYFADIKINLLWAQGQEDKEEERQDEGTSKFLRDPFVYLVDKSRLKPSGEEDSSLEKVLFPMVLRGLMVQEGKAVAVINEEVVTEGQTWHDLKVERIDKDGVTLTYQGRNLRLVMKESDAQAKTAPQDIKKMPSAGRK